MSLATEFPLPAGTQPAARASKGGDAGSVSEAGTAFAELLGAQTKAGTVQAPAGRSAAGETIPDGQSRPSGAGNETGSGSADSRPDAQTFLSDHARPLPAPAPSEDRPDPSGASDSSAETLEPEAQIAVQTADSAQARNSAPAGTDIQSGTSNRPAGDTGSPVDVKPAPDGIATNSRAEAPVLQAPGEPAARPSGRDWREDGLQAAAARAASQGNSKQDAGSAGSAKTNAVPGETQPASPPAAGVAAQTGPDAGSKPAGHQAAATMPASSGEAVPGGKASQAEDRPVSNAVISPSSGEAGSAKGPRDDKSGPGANVEAGGDAIAQGMSERRAEPARAAAQGARPAPDQAQRTQGGMAAELKPQPQAEAEAIARDQAARMTEFDGRKTPGEQVRERATELREAMRPAQPENARPDTPKPSTPSNPPAPATPQTSAAAAPALELAKGGLAAELAAITQEPVSDPASTDQDFSLDALRLDRAERGTDLARAAAASPHTARMLPAQVQTLAARIAQRFNEGTRVFDIRIDPPELGRVDVRLEMGRDNRVNAILTAERPEALAELQRSARDLEKSLAEAGLDLGEDGLSFELADQNTSGDGTREHSGQGRAFALPVDGAVADITSPARTIAHDIYGFAVAARARLDMSV